MPECRKYTRAEIEYVLQRVAAGWQPRNIALQFKLDHPEWNTAEKTFGSKQVSYIKGAYSTMPGDIVPFSGPEPSFVNTKSLHRHQQLVNVGAAQHSVQHNSFQNAQQNNHQIYPVAANSPSTASILSQQQTPRPTGQAQHYEASPQIEHGLSAGDINDFLANLDPTMISFESNFNQGQSSPSNFTPNNNQGQASSSIINPDFNQGLLSPSILLSGYEQQVEIEQPKEPAESETANAATMRPVNVPADRLPPNCTLPKATHEDADGIWYAGPHDYCLVHANHRHDFTGGIYFANYEALEQSNEAVRNLQGFDVIWGMASTMQTLQREGDRYCNHMLCMQARDLAQRFVDDHFPADHPMRYRPLKVPQPEVFALWTEINLRLPKGYFYEPFSDSVYPVSALPDAQGNALLMDMGISLNHINAVQQDPEVLTAVLRRGMQGDGESEGEHAVAAGVHGHGRQENGEHSDNNVIIANDNGHEANEHGSMDFVSNDIHAHAA